MKITFVNCHCGKLHCVGGLSRNSLCTCGRNLWMVFAGLA